MGMIRDIKRQIGTGIPSNTENNPRREENEYVKAITLRSNKEIPRNENTELDPEKVAELKAEPETEPNIEPVLTKLPFPSRLKNKRKHMKLSL
ncbi:acidic leucine-rich nuclear phosphoprotein 32 family member B-like [Gossypium australe]|uniref:Acidic leucine-rich nuclear phosphoprotein 32 family member B-like n=1 Tax=Gossypium australe TaxID=47621 RepID=A0A5B6VC88_9ROSI|nr:acidic leucine-rich nuclear phosphoprotein 32 family member B-like [Gossypium australe]